MKPRNTINVAYKNEFLYQELVKHGRLLNNTQYTRDLDSAKGFRRKKRSDETVAREKAEKRYVTRKNLCTTCWEYKAVGSGACACD